MYRKWIVRIAVVCAIPIGNAVGAMHYYSGTGNYYEWHSVPHPTWSSARDMAAALSYQGTAGELVTITSAGEQAFIESIMTSDLAYYEAPWIGATWDETWQWVSGEPWSYTHWSPGEPSQNGPYAYIYEWGIAPSMAYRWDDNWDPVVADGFFVEFDRFDAGGPYNVWEGNPTTQLNGFSAVYPQSATWDIDGDGQFDDASGLHPTITYEFLNSLGIYSECTRTISLNVDGFISDAILIVPEPSALIIIGVGTMLYMRRGHLRAG